MLRDDVLSRRPKVLITIVTIKYQSLFTIMAFVVSSFIAGISGALHAYLLGLIGPDLTREKLVDKLESIQNFDSGGLGKIQYGPNIRKGTHEYRVLQCDMQKKQFIPVTDWREPSLKWGER